jgi:prepilin-type N-terminal cleavage/methylation domain-containing protein
MKSHRIFHTSARGFIQHLTSRYSFASFFSRKKAPCHVRNAKLSAGFTLIEILVVIGLFLLIFTLSTFVGFDSIARSTVFGDRDIFVSLLTTARAHALGNVNQKPQGVHIGLTNFVLFEGSSYSTSSTQNRPVPRTSAISITGPTDIIFDQLSGNVSTGLGTTTLSENAKTAEININAVGRIEW